MIQRQSILKKPSKIVEVDGELVEKRCKERVRLSQVVRKLLIFAL